ncbi:purine-nucleoside phosphorylase [Pseudenhygromyxa sp. WMMC2535]|uniref:purine-nucleoside phosphorylase n=1 Tax=Pseudenhygromyxa sp. WMMC2535 TaxID=2712867 RepID=UPI0015572764|nr:purine-nucleoside phosphorylase [Pseudenhygromyxa sp. WMMC2535]NVB37119.1 purine-nucleoside phosphorylase [Pseudenhygromyxa sp. WMMC2535]
MTKRLLPFLLLACTAVTLNACSDDGSEIGDGLEIFIDDWEEVLRGPADSVETLSIGDQLTSDNFANRGDIEVTYVEGATEIVVEMQRFTVAKSQGQADEAFGRMAAWTYDISSPSKPDPTMDEALCFAEETEDCYVRTYYDGQIQPTRDGANFRVSIPVGWDGDLVLVTEDNLGQGNYPDRSDVSVMGLAGNLEVTLDSGNVAVKLDPSMQHYAGCGSNDACEEMDHAPDCGCTEPTNIVVENEAGQSSNVTVDLADPDKWYTVQLENKGEFSASDDFICTATIDCSAFADCLIDPDFENVDYKQWAEINYPGEPAIAGAGLRIDVASENCENVEFVDDPTGFDIENGVPEIEKRGDLNVCVNCL